MARIEPEEIERLKREVSIERLVEAAGVELRRHGKDLLGLCPLHDDREPSLVVTPDKNLWHCLGACQTGGSVIDWVMKAEGVSFRHAVELLRKDLPSLAACATKRDRGGRGEGLVKHSTTPKLPVLERNVDDDVLLRKVIDDYHETLKQSPEALGYLEKRGLRSHEMLERFRLGFSNRTLGYRLPQKNRKAGAELRSRLQTLGILRASGHEHFVGSLVVPILDAEGRVLEAYGRKITEGLRRGTPLHLYLPGPHRGVWNLEALEASDEVILCESLIDALTFWCAGFRNVTASYGIEGVTDDHEKAFAAHDIRRVLIAYDRDDAGDKAAVKLAKRLSEMGIESARVQFPKGMDANEYALKVQPAAKSLEVALRQAVWLGKGQGRKVQSTVPAAAPAVPEPPAVREPTTGQKAHDHEPSPRPEPVAEPEPKFAEHESPSKASELPSPMRDESVAGAASADEVTLELGDRHWRVRGLAKNASPASLKVNILVSREGAGFHVDTLELYSARQRQQYIAMAVEELSVEPRVLKRDLGQVLLRLEELADERTKKEAEAQRKTVQLTDGEHKAALDLLRAPNLLDRMLEDFEKCGVVGERTNKLVGFLAAVSRKLPEPLAVVIQSSSAAGKSSLMEAILAFVPDEERVQYSAMTGQSLFYMGESDLQHKVLAIVEEEGAERASYALKLLQSEGQLTIASTGKDPTTGRLVTQEYRVEGPVMIFLTTTAIEVDEELLNRCIVLSVDEGREQTKAIHARQRAAQTLEGMLRRHDKTKLVALHQNAQRLLRPLHVVNPYAERLRFLDHQTRTRRDHMKYLTLIRSIALLHQYQREVKTVEHRGETLRYIEVTPGDIRVANELCHEVLGRSLDELPTQTRRLLGLVDAMVTAECDRQGLDRADYRFSRRQVREATGWGNTQLKVHLGRLREMEYLVVHRQGHSQRFVYELVYEGSGDGRHHLPGLIDVDATGGHEYDANRSGQNADRSGPGRPPAGPWSGAGRSDETASQTSIATEEPTNPSPDAAKARRGTQSPPRSYVLKVARPTDDAPAIAEAQ